MTVARPRQYSGQSPDERTADRVGRLRAAGLDLFGTVGYAATRVEQLCSHARVSTKHFYLSYANKEAAFLDLYSDITSGFLAAATRSLVESEGLPLVERIPPAFLAYMRPMLEDIRIARIAIVEIMGVSPAVEARRLEYRESLAGIVTTYGTEAVARGEIADRDFRFATICLAGAANAAVYDWAVRPDREDAAAMEAKLGALALTLLAG